MKRVLQFKITGDGYGCFENDELVFEIKKSDLQFNVKSFYHAFYGEDKDIENIVVENTVEDDRDATRVYKCIQTLVAQISDKFQELHNDVSCENNDME